MEVLSPIIVIEKHCDYSKLPIDGQKKEVVSVIDHK